MLTKIFLPILLCLLPLNSYSRFLVEPAFKQYAGRFNGNDGRGDLTGQVLALDTGYLGENFMIGLSFEKGQFTYDENLTSSGYTKFNGGGVGSFIGFHLFDRFKVWTGYLNSSLEPTSNNETRYFGQQVSFGLGLRISDGFMANIQSYSNHFTQLEDDTTGKTSGLDKNIITKGEILSLSYILIF